MTRNSAQATIRKLITKVTKWPQAITAPCFLASSSVAAVTFDESGMKWLEKSSPPVIAPMLGVMISATREFTIAPNAAARKGGWGATPKKKKKKKKKKKAGSFFHPEGRGLPRPLLAAGADF